MYAVVEFTDGLEVDVIPCSWLTENKKKAYWPMWRNSDKIHAAVKRCTIPGADYMCLDVRVLYESDNFDKARGKLSNAVLTSSLETTDIDDAIREEKVQKRKKRPNPKYNDLSSTESEGEDIPAPLRRSPRKKANSFPELPPLPVLPPLPSPLPQRKEPTLTEPSKQPSGVRSPHLSSPASPTLIQKAQPRVTATEIKIISILEEIKGQVRFNTKLLQNIQTKVDVPFPVGGNEPELDLGIDFPLKNLEDLDSLEEKLENVDIVKALLSNLCSIGGDSLQSNVRRLLSFLLKNELALQLNWKGKGKKRGFSTLKLKNVVLKAVRKNRFCAQATDDDIEKLIKDWLRYAADRDGGRKKREEKKRNNAREAEGETE
ncbi:uncharacterized protein LOC133174249 [Saccostrea echinata]|uniref:uncharacterized protein LOC133174249 n=1 Tax=Saccostrea echinata TaxID=191078 RepID=UPI002A800471|nr:uncharacterized protein LOC133174249 [Saccostrea echinata]